MSWGLPRLTEYLRAHADGDESALGSLFERCSRELRSLARRQLSHERRDHTLQPTALVHEAYLRLFDGAPPEFTNSSSFYVAVVREMRRVLTDHARRRLAQKRCGASGHESVDGIDLPVHWPDAFTLVALSEAMDLLAAEDPRAADVVDLKFLAGLSTDEIASVYGVTPRTIERDWQFARARLRGVLGAP